LPPKPEDCFAEFDKVFDSLSQEFDWIDAEPVKRDNETEGAALVPQTTQLALVQPKPVPPPPAPSVSAPEGDLMDEYEQAFSELDDKLAESDKLAEENRLAESEQIDVSELPDLPELPESPVRPRPAAHATVRKMRPAPMPLSAGTLAKAAAKVTRPPKRQVRTLADVFGVLDKLSVVRRRGRLSEERHHIARVLADTRQVCADLELESARVRVEFAVLTLESNHFDKLGHELDELVRHLRHDLRFCSIGPGKKAASR
jgi:hypothetical protein